MAYIMTRIKVGDYEKWKPQFDADLPRAREAARRVTIFRAVDDPNHVFIQIEFETTQEALVSRDRLLASGVLDRFAEKFGPTVVETAEVVERAVSRVS